MCQALVGHSQHLCLPGPRKRSDCFYMEHTENPQGFSASKVVDRTSLCPHRAEGDRELSGASFIRGSTLRTQSPPKGPTS